MKRLKAQIIEEHQLPTSSTSSSTCDLTSSTSFSTCDPTSSTSSSTHDPTSSTSSHTIRSNDTYVYGIGMLIVLAIGVCVILHTSLSLKIKNLSMKSRINHQKDVICFRSDDEKKNYIING